MVHRYCNDCAAPYAVPCLVYTTGCVWLEQHCAGAFTSKTIMNRIIKWTLFVEKG